MSNHPVYLEISEIESHINSIKSEKNKIDFLLSIREELIHLCYHVSDKKIDKYLEDYNIISRFPKILYNPSNDIYQTHISGSEHILLLKHIDSVLLPWVREYITKLDSSIKENTSGIIKDYKIFDFDIVKVIDYANQLQEDKINYLFWIMDQYADYYYVIYQVQVSDSENNVEKVREVIRRSPFCIKIYSCINALRRHPEIILPNVHEEERLKSIQFISSFYFNDEPLVFEFNFKRIKGHLNSLKDKNEKISYLEYVKKEAKQNKLYFVNNDKLIDLLENIEIEIEYIDRVPNIPISVKPQIVNNPKMNHLIKFRWQKDNVLLPYLFEVLLDEGFISQSDYEDRHKFIEQSFLKKNGKPFTAKETDQSEVNYHSNTKTNKKPRNAFKVDRIAEKLKSKEKKPK